MCSYADICSKIDALVIVLSNDIIKNPLFSDLVALAQSKETQVVLIHPEGVQFPSPSAIAELPPKVREIFNSIALSYLEQYVSRTWEQLRNKLVGHVGVK